jgi:DNA-binding GntR family transcriptional regulator
MMSKMPGRPMRVFEEHAALLDALERNDPAGAVAAMEHYIKSGWDEFRSNHQAIGTTL